MDIRAKAHELSEEMLAWRRDFHAHPELSNNEFRTTEKIVELLESFGCDSVERPLPTGAVALIKGGKPGKCVALRADIDALPVTEATGLPFASENAGVMHACGHDTHISMLLATAKLLCGMREELPGTVKLIFQPAEEKAPRGGARPMVEAGVMENPHVDAILSTHISPGGPKVGSVSFYRGIVTTAFDLYNVSVTGQNAHGSQPQNGHDAILALAQFIVNAQQIVARRVDPLKTAIVSNKPDQSVRALRDDFFPAVTLAVGQTEGIPRKPSPTMVEKALHDLGIKKDDAVYIGDSEVDFETARRAAMDVILVSWGFRDRAELEALGKAVIVDTREALSAYLLGSVQKSD